MTVPPILEAVDLSFCYDGCPPAVDGLSFRLGQGVRLAMLGANGAGKTTVLRLLNGTLRPRAGQVKLDGEPVRYSRRALLAWRQAVGLLLQDPDDQLFAASVYQDVSFGPLNLGLEEDEVRRRVDEALGAIGAADLAERPTHALSFGQGKRVALAGILAMRPRVLLLDEPTAGLDPAGREQLLAHLEALHAGGATLLVATHNLDFAWSWADEVLVLERGAVARQAPPAEALADRELLARTHLRPPLLLELAQSLGEQGLLPPAAAPRSLPELLGLLDANRAPGAWPG